jgi:DNA-binding response OmpR family regulator
LVQQEEAAMPGHLLVIDDNPTVLKVIEMALSEAGYRISSARDDQTGLALMRQETTAPDLILLDGLIPDRDAADICRRFAADKLLARVPVVLMMARGQGDDAERRFAKARNVVDTIGKPFSPEALQAIVSHVVGRATSSPAAQPTPAAAAAAEAPPDAAEPQPARQVVHAALEEVLSRSADPGTLAGARAFAAAGQALAGDLAAIAISDVLELLAARAHGGILRVVNTQINARIEIFFRAGRIDFATAVGAPEELLFGRFVVSSGDVTPERLEQVLAARARPSGTLPPLGADLVARGLLSAEGRLRAITRQTTELTCETLRWQTGFFQFRLTDQLPSLASEAALGLNVDRVLLEGYRRVDEWRVIEREVASFDEVFVRDDDKINTVPRGTFTRDELAVMTEIDGRQSVRDIVRKLRMGSFDVSRIVFRLGRARLVRRRVAPAAG